MVFQCSCGCCAAFRPRYKRLIDNIYRTAAADGIDKSNLEKLTFYALLKPEKLDRIGDYLAQRIGRDLYRHRPNYVSIGIEAMDRLLTTSKSQSLNLFVESFLRIVQQLLESHDYKMQLMATQSFVRFANIEEDTPSYHRRYDFFVSKFASMAHHSDEDRDRCRQLRMAGLNGLKGVIRKTVSDDLQANIWEESHMDKIVPSLLYNMQSAHGNNGSHEHQSHTHNITAIAETPLISPTFADISPPAMVAEDCLRELMRRATFGHVKSVIKPVLKHIDNHELWHSDEAADSGEVDERFCVKTFRIVMYSIQSQHSYTVIQILMNHLDDTIRAQESSSNQDIKIKIGMVNVLSSIIAIAAADSIGPSVLEIINSLLEHLRGSISNHGKRELQFQEAILKALKEFAGNLPDYQRTEILFFIKSRAPTVKSDSLIGVKLQEILSELRGSAHETHYKPRQDSSLSRSDINSISVDVESNASSMDVSCRKTNEDPITFESLKKCLEEPLGTPEEIKCQIIDWFKTATLDELMAKANSAKDEAGDYYKLSVEIASKFVC